MAETDQSGFARFPLENVALGLLVPGPKHGYGLFQDFEQYFGLIWKAGQTKFYLTLADLQYNDYLDSTIEPQESHPPRKVYCLTDPGRDKFMDWVTRPNRSVRGMRVEFIAKLRFYNLLDLPGADTLVDCQLDIFNTLMEEWWQASLPEKPEESKDRHDHFADLVYSFRMQQVQSIITWLEEVRQRIESGRFA
ncbi:MAG: PadR family transcriptional regulator [Anaerolineae bacterium]|nr:PadR family transcriptional regulator [Anaerolineae bacterium]